jgi:mannan polymerase complexes MNN9 subunit
LKQQYTEFDLNTWKGTRIKPTLRQWKGMAATGKIFVPRHDEVQFLGDLSEQEWVEVDSVGGTFLYARSLLFREGLAFPSHYIIGQEWGREGYDGIETEGLCHNARFLGYKCWGIANEFTVHGKHWPSAGRVGSLSRGGMVLGRSQIIFD